MEAIFFCFQGMRRQQRSLRQRQHGVMWHSMQRRWQQRQQPRAACFLQKLRPPSAHGSIILEPQNSTKNDPKQVQRVQPNRTDYGFIN
jgi:hypothetical protein